jgi:PEP-CTERM motif
MKIAIKLVLGAIAVFCLSARTAHATLVDAGDITLDRATGLEWLHLDKTTGGLSYQDILNNAGGFYAAGWRSATWDQVNGVLATYNSFAPADRSMLGIFGVTTFDDFHSYDFYYTEGYFAENTGYVLMLWLDQVDRRTHPPTIIFSASYAAADSASLDIATPAHPMQGYWLVKPVPEPTTLALMGVGVLAVLRKARR